MADEVSNQPADWYPDPFGRHEVRYWDGTAWTEHVASHGRQSQDPPTGTPRIPQAHVSADKVQKQVQRTQESTQKRGDARTAAFVGDGTLMGEPVLVVNQKAKLIEVNNEYAIYDRSGIQLGAVRQIGQSGAKKVLRVLTSLDQYFTHKLQVVDMSGNVVMAITRPAKLVKSRVIIQDGAGNDIGEVRQENRVGKIRFGFYVGEQRVGGIYGENWRAWNFAIKDADDREIARITKTFEGVAKTLFTTADNYVLQIHQQLDQPLKALVVAAALSVDTALKQDQRGFG